MKTYSLTIDGNPVKVHAISTGRVAVKTKFRETRRKGVMAALSLFLDKEFTEWMPIWTWLIEHPEGNFLVDTGENANVNDKDYFKSSGRFMNWMNTTQFRFDVEREDEIDRQLDRLGIPASEVGTVILTHLHLDHIDGLRHFPHARILVHKLEWDKPYGDLPALYPDWFDPEKIELDGSFGEFKKCVSLTADQNLWLVHTPGHTHGHCSVLLNTDQGYLLFAGDVVYHQSQLLENKFAGGNVSVRQAMETYEMIRRFAADNKMVFLPSHDAECPERLDKMLPLMQRV